MKKSAVELSCLVFDHELALKKVIVVDMKDTKKNMPYWCHKSEWLAHVFKEDANGNLKQHASILDPFLHQFFSVQRRETPGGPDVPAFKTTKKGTTVYNYVLCALVDKPFGDDELLQKLQSFGTCASNETFQQALFLTAQFNIELKENAIVSSLKPRSTNPSNVYYSKLEVAASNIKIRHCVSLNKVFLDKEIYPFISSMFDVTTDYTEWEDHVKCMAWLKAARAKKNTLIPTGTEKDTSDV